MFYFAKISRKNTKTLLKIYANVKNVNVIDNAVIYYKQKWSLLAGLTQDKQKALFFCDPSNRTSSKTTRKNLEVL